jgi:mRNA-degrading endonuclease RelE of RelBE toxin-antitoxin system
LTWTVVQARRFARQYKKLPDNTAAAVDDAVAAVADNPKIGERKKGDLARLRVYKFHCGSQLYLLGNTSDDEVIRLVTLEAVAPHENFYRDIKR